MKTKVVTSLPVSFCSKILRLRNLTRTHKIKYATKFSPVQALVAIYLAVYLNCENVDSVR